MSATPESLTPPPAATGELTLTPPAPVAAVARRARPRAWSPIDAAAVPGLDAKVAEYVDGIVDLDVHSPAFAAKAGDVAAMGDDDIRASAETSNRLLASPVRAMQHGALSEGVQGRGHAARPAPHDRGPRPQAGHRGQEAPRHDPVRRQDRATTSASTRARSRTSTRSSRRSTTARTSCARTTPRSSRRRCISGRRCSGSRSTSTSRSASTPRSTAKIAEIEATDPEKAKALRDDVLFYARQKHQDLLTQQAVSIQGYLAIDLVRKNNLELIKGVDRATTTTVAALRTAVIVAQALANQKLVLDQITALEHHDVEADRVDLGAARDPERRHQQAGGVDDDRHRVAAHRVRRTSTSRWTRSTRSRPRRSTRWRRR